MYQYIKGVITEVKPTFVTLENNNIGFLIVVPNPFRFESALNTEVQIFIEQIVREDSLTLYGFKTEKEKAMFNSLLKVTGIGPKSALAILAASTPNEIIHAIENEDQAYLQKFPGIGKKSSMQIILDLKGKLSYDEELVETVQVTTKSNDVIIDEALMTLEALGYSKRELTKLDKHLKQLDIGSVEEAVKQGLKFIVE